ncbi:dihydrofolate reductase family protein [Feifania hominis]|uniref:Dihydrofolate reductase n=1 Tax=Feifania hominis TaxID=2763660 RepID=A0A926HVB8_9FIRM|nr:dihydrofolate reductase family protein [Feifania hominis]MBC8536451.1 dihydrofolate reductase [Feifania hominis]
MRRVTLYLGISLDGFLADRSGGVDWMTGEDPDAGDAGAYDRFVAGVDTVVMGWNTYRQITEELSPGRWVYGGLTSYVITHRRLPSTQEIHFVDEDPCALVRRLRSQPGRDIWICGGAGVAQPLIAGNLIDRYQLSLLPIVLGGGIPLFGRTDAPLPLRLIGSSSVNGIVELTYERR